MKNKIISLLLSLTLILGIVGQCLTVVSFAATDEENLFSGGIGTPEEPYLISTADDLCEMADSVEQSTDFASAYYQLTTDINLAGSTFKGIGRTNIFSGEFDGKGCTIDNYVIDTNENRVGVFNQLSGTVKNLNIGKNVNIRAAHYAGGLAGYSLRATIINCSSYATVEATTSDVGGLVGQMNGGSMLNCYSVSKVTSGGVTAGGLAGYAGSYNCTDSPTKIKNSYSASSISSTSFGGVAVGYNDDLYPAEFENVFIDTSFGTAVGNGVATSGTEAKSTWWMQSFYLVDALNEQALLNGWESWKSVEDDYPMFGVDESINELKEFMSSISDSVDIAPGQASLELPASKSGRYLCQLYGSDNKQVIDLEGKIYTPLIDTEVNLIYHIVDTQKDNLLVAQVDYNILANVLGSMGPGTNACPNVVPRVAGMERRNRQLYFNRFSRNRSIFCGS